MKRGRRVNAEYVGRNGYFFEFKAVDADDPFHTYHLSPAEVGASRPVNQRTFKEGDRVVLGYQSDGSRGFYYVV